MAEPNVIAAGARIAAWKKVRNTQAKFDIYRDHSDREKYQGTDYQTLHMYHQSDLELVADAYLESLNLKESS